MSEQFEAEVKRLVWLAELHFLTAMRIRLKTPEAIADVQARLADLHQRMP